MNQQQLSTLIKLVEKGSNICIDSRTAAANDLFFALKGDNADGNHFAENAINAGCAYAIIDNPKFDKGNKYILVKDVLSSLQELARHYRSKFNIPFLGITGTNGKTTTKELMHAVLSQSFPTSATQGNLNNHIGVPLTLLSLKKASELAIIEMGANHIGEIAQLSELARPTHAVITNIGKAHLEGFGSIDNIETAKTELFHYVAGRDGILFVNHDDERLKKHATPSNAILYGKDALCHCSGDITATFPFVSVGFRTNKDFGKAAAGAEGIVHSKLTGGYNFGNIMAAITAGLYFGVPTDAIIRAIESYEPKNSRSQVIETGNNTVLMDAYNANPTSMAAALENFINYPAENKAVLLGDMLELGKDAIAEHQQIFELVQKNKFPLQVFVGDNFSTVSQSNKNTLVFKDVHDAVSWLKKNRVTDHHILIKGSRGIKMEKLLDCL